VVKTRNKRKGSLQID